MFGFRPAGLLVPLFLLSVTSAGLRPAAPAEDQADLVVTGGRIVTLCETSPRAEALAVKGGRIAALGASREIRKWIGPQTQVLDVGGKLVTPGLIDSHVHLLGLGRAKQQLDLTGTTSQREIVRLVRRRAEELPPNRWVIGRGWDQNDWDGSKFPTHRSLTEAAPDRPVLLVRIDGHAAWVNRKALELVRIDRHTLDPPGGRILRDENGEATGVLIDAAADLVWGKIPPATEVQRIEALKLATSECVEMGLTSVHEAGADRQAVALFERAAHEGQLPVRVYLMLAGSDRPLLDEAFADGPRIGLADDHLTIRAVKLFADGALGSRGAALLEPYADEPTNRGLLLSSEDEIADVSRRALAAGYQVCTHAIGDRGNRIVLDAYQRAFGEHPQVNDPRFRVEHAQILDATDVPRFAQLGLIASMQATHCTSDMPWVSARIGPARAEEGAYLWQTLLAGGARIANGSDAPVESLNPLWGIYAAITRQDHAGRPSGGWYPKQRMTRMQALRSFTLDAAYASFEEDLKGSLEVGKLADFVVWSDDLLSIEPRAILTTRAEWTVVGGRVVYGDRLTPGDKP